MNEKTRQKILKLLDEHRIMTIDTLRPDGWLTLCGLESQKAKNLAHDNRVSLTIDHDTPQVMDITGLSMVAHAQAVSDPAEGEKIMRLLVQGSTRTSNPLSSLCQANTSRSGSGR